MIYEIWLNDTHFLFDHGIVHYENGETKELTCVTEVSPRGAECLVVMEPGMVPEDCAFSWYSKFGILEPETWDASLEQIIFHNIGTRDLYIWRYSYLKPGQNTRIRHLDTHHDTYLGVFRPLGMGKLLFTTHSDPEIRALLGHHGLVLYKHVDRESNTVRVRFVIDTCDQGYTFGFESSTGELSLDADNRVLLVTTHSKYVFELDYNASCRR